MVRGKLQSNELMHLITHFDQQDICLMILLLSFLQFGIR